MSFTAYHNFPITQDALLSVSTTCSRQVFRPIPDWIEINQYIVDFSSRQRWPLSGDVTVGPEFIAEKKNDMIK